MANEYERTYHYIIDKFMGMDMSSTRQGIDPRRGRELTDFYVTPDGALAPRYGMVPICVASSVTESPLESYVNAPMALGPRIMVVTNGPATNICATFRSLAIPQMNYSVQQWLSLNDAFGTCYGDGFPETGYQYPDEIVGPLHAQLDNTDYFDMIDVHDLAPWNIHTHASVPYSLPMLSGVHTMFKGTGYYVDGMTCQTLYEKEAGGYDFSYVDVVPAEASLWADTGTIIDITPWKDRLFVLDSNKRLFFSAILDAATWDVLDYLDFSGMDEGEPAGIQAVGDRLVVATTRAKYAVVGDTPDAWRITPAEGRGVKTQDLFVYKYAGGTIPCNEPAVPLWTKDPRGNIYYVGDDNLLHVWDGYHEYSLSAMFDPTTFQNPFAIAYNDGKLYISTTKERSASPEVWFPEYLPVDGKQTVAHDLATYVINLATHDVTRMPYVFTAFAQVPAAPGYYRGTAPTRLIGIQAIPFPDVEAVVSRYAYTYFSMTSIAVIDDPYSARAFDSLYYTVPEASVVGGLESTINVRYYHPEDVVGVYVSKDIDMGLPDKYKLYKTLTLNIDGCTEEYMEAQHNERYLYSIGADSTWSDTGTVWLEAAVDGADWTSLGEYTIDLSNTQVESVASPDPITGVSPTRPLPPKGQLRLIPPTFGVVMGRSIKIRIRSTRCVIRKLDIEYAVRSMIPPTTTTEFVVY